MTMPRTRSSPFCHSTGRMGEAVGDHFTMRLLLVTSGSHKLLYAKSNGRMALRVAMRQIVEIGSPIVTWRRKRQAAWCGRGSDTPILAAMGSTDDIRVN